MADLGAKPIDFGAFPDEVVNQLLIVHQAWTALESEKANRDGIRG